MKIITIILFFIIINIKNSYSDVIKQTDLLPIEPNVSVLTISSLVKTSDDNLKQLNHNHIFNIAKLSGNSVGYYQGNKLRYSIDLESEENKSSINSLTEHQSQNVKNLRLSFLTKPAKVMGGSLEGLGFFSLIPETNISYECITFENQIVGGNKENCSKDGLVIYESKLNNRTEPALFVKSDKVGLGFALRQHYNSWNNKTIISITSILERIEHDINLGNGFKSINSSQYLNIYPQNEQFISKTIQSKISTSRSFYGSWSYALGYTKLLINYKDNIKLKNNSLIDLNLSKKFKNNLFLSLNSLYSNNYLLGNTGYFYIPTKNSIKFKSYKELKLTIGYLFPEKNFGNQYDENIDFENLLEEKKKFKLKPKTKIDKKLLKGNSSTKKSTIENLSKFALNFAQKLDKIDIKSKSNNYK